MPNLCRALFALVVLLAAGPAFADGFVPIPESSGKMENLQIRFVRYDGSTNGQMVVDIKNTGRTAARFQADGIFFVPKGDPEKAPQRLGAAGPFVIAQNGKMSKHLDTLAVGGGQTQRVHLEVFCIDSHRSSPSPSTKFAVAKNRLPKKLRRELDVSNKAILKAKKGHFGSAKSAIQSNMWSKRDAEWIKLEGERKNEKSPSKTRPHRNQLQNMESQQQFAQPPAPQQRSRSN